MSLNTIVAAKLLEVSGGRARTPNVHAIGLRGLNAHTPRVEVPSTQVESAIRELATIGTPYALSLQSQLSNA